MRFDAVHPVFVALVLLGQAVGAWAADSALRMTAPAETLRVIGGGVLRVSPVFENTADEVLSMRCVLRMFQTGGGLAAPWWTSPERTLSMGPRQRVIEDWEVPFPAVRGVSRFQLRWVTPDGKLLGTGAVEVHPPGILTELNALAGRGGVVLAGGHASLVAALTAQGVHHATLASDAGGVQDGALVIAISESVRNPDDALSARRIRDLAKRSGALVWFPPADADDAVTPAYYMVDEEQGSRIVVAQRRTIEGIETDPLAQLRLVQMARMATGRTRLLLPETR